MYPLKCQNYSDLQILQKLGPQIKGFYSVCKYMFHPFKCCKYEVIEVTVTSVNTQTETAVILYSSFATNDDPENSTVFTSAAFMQFNQIQIVSSL